ELHRLGDGLVVWTIDARLEDEEADRQLALELVAGADHGAFRHVRMREEHLLDRAGRETVPRNVDDVVRSRHHEDVAVLVDEAGIGGLVVAREGGEVGSRDSARPRSRAWATSRAAAVASLPGRRSRPAGARFRPRPSRVRPRQVRLASAT